ncbi:PilN domain-containing protein [Pedobacter sp. Leaf176]|uniref:PilN domain-containing protein n=1 Tax=Pedobacter sp. Leaf176 TaxID=1736286 RepID=UPI0006F4A0B8|nr:PilN domain-containing protein [Pedobacter sp. Leaf176]KQR70885.1 hypothetical protein ASF92_05620 [Pedobacter sp. Leaf176]
MIGDDGINTVLGLELILLGEQHYEARYCLLKKKGSTIDIEIKKTIQGTLVKVLEVLPKNFPVSIVFSGKGILYKMVDAGPDAQQEQLAISAFPGVQLKDFYKQVLEGDKHAVVHLARKMTIDPLLETFGKAGFKVFACSLGASVSSQIWTLLNAYDTLLSFGGHQFTLSESKKLLSYRYQQDEKNKFPLKIADQAIDEIYVLSYAAAFQLILHDKLTLVLADVDSVNLRFVDLSQNVGLKKKAFLFLTGLFVSLLASFLVFSHYNTENAGLAGKAGAQAASAGQVDLLKKSIAEDEALLNKMHWHGGYNYGFILNEIARSCPVALSLTEVSVNGVGKRGTESEVQPEIKISGQTGNLTAVNNWLFMLKEKKWVKSVKLLGFNQDNESEDYQFNLLIAY